MILGLIACTNVSIKLSCDWHIELREPSNEKHTGNYSDNFRMNINKVKFLKAQSLFEQRQYAAAIRKIKNRSSLDEELFYSKLLVMQNKPNEALAHLDRLAKVYKKIKLIFFYCSSLFFKRLVSKMWRINYLLK